MRTTTAKQFAERVRERVLTVSCISLWMLLLVTSRSAGAETPQGSDLTGMGDLGSATIKMFGSLALIIGIIICIFYLIKRVRLGPLSMNRYPQMHLVGTLSLAPKRSIALVEIGGQWLVLGVGTENVALLTKLDGPPESDSGDALAPTNRGSFQSLLQEKILRRRLFTGGGRREK